MPLVIAAPETIADLSDDQLVALARRGDRAAMARLLMRYRGFVRRLARGYFSHGGDREEVVQQGMEGLKHSIHTYDASRRKPFRAFAERCISRRIRGTITHVRTAADWSDGTRDLPRAV